MQDITDTTFHEQVLHSDQPVLVDFWAPWCGPCRMTTPILESLEQERTDLRIVKMNVDENEQIPAILEIQSIPTLILFKEGKPIAKVVGAPQKQLLSDKLDQLLA